AAPGGPGPHAPRPRASPGAPAGGAHHGGRHGEHRRPRGPEACAAGLRRPGRRRPSRLSHRPREEPGVDARAARGVPPRLRVSRVGGGPVRQPETPELFEEAARRCKIFYDDGDDPKVVLELATRREPVNIAMHRLFDGEGLERLCGWRERASTRARGEDASRSENANYTR
ncbi:unnamed protein product, partial [Prorocentrum cordatum]